LKILCRFADSGTTGVPKLIRMNKQNMVNSALATGDFFDLSPVKLYIVYQPDTYQENDVD
jgi:O-succinylbenzoic acid--CoA ligase